MPQPDHQHPQHSDMPATGWWRMLPHSLHRFIYLGRFDRPIGWWLLLLPGWWVIPVGAPRCPHVVAYGLVSGGAIITRAAGCVINDLWDRRLDQQVERTQQRPLASGAVSVLVRLYFWAFSGRLALAFYGNYQISPFMSVWPRRRLSSSIRWPNASPGFRSLFWA